MFGVSRADDLSNSHRNTEKPTSYPAPDCPKTVSYRCTYLKIHFTLFNSFLNSQIISQNLGSQYCGKYIIKAQP